MKLKHNIVLVYINDWCLLFIIAIIFISSCNSPRYIYSASPPNYPIFTEKGQSKFAAYYSATPGNSITEKLAEGLDLQGAFALSNHWAVTGSIYKRREKDFYKEGGFAKPFKSSEVKYKRNVVELGAGYFASVNPPNTITINFYAGAAAGKFSIIDDGVDINNVNYNREYNSDKKKFFFQPALNFIPNPNFNVSLIFKSSYVHYTNNRTSYTADELRTFQLDLIDNKTLNFIEPAINVEFGFAKYPWIKLGALISGVANQPLHRDNVRNSNSSVGLTFDFSKLKKTQPAKIE
ncbi:MAG: hypothetical protein ABIO05_01725 [Ferruginibacter sp.]